MSDTQWASWRCTCVEKSKGDVAVLAFATVSTSFDYHFEMIMLQYTDALSMRSEFVPCIWNAFMVLLLPSYEHHSTKTHTHTLMHWSSESTSFTENTSNSSIAFPSSKVFQPIPVANSVEARTAGSPVALPGQALETDPVFATPVRARHSR